FNVDASQLRGSLQYQSSEPNYTLAESIEAGLNQWGGAAKTSFARTTVNLAKASPESNITFIGTDPISDFHFSRLNRTGFFSDITKYGGRAANVGTGTLATVQGNVTIRKAWLKDVNDRQGTLPGNLSMTGTTISGWTTASGAVHPILTMDTLLGDLVLTGSP